MPFITQGKTNWKFLLIVIILAVIVGGGALWYSRRPEQPYQPVEIKKTESVIKDETADWKVYRNDEYGFEMKYPEELLSTEPLQPKMKSIDCDYANFANKCPFVPIEGFTGSEEEAIRQGFAKTERLVINGKPFCLQTMVEGAAGTTYVTYNYTTVRDKKCLVLSFAVPYPNCSNYLPISNPEIQKAYDQCKTENEITKPETINQMLSTFRFIEPGDGTCPFLSYEEVIQILNSGKVKSIFQFHDLRLSMILKDDRCISTKQQVVDDILQKIEECGDLCKDVIFGTE